MISLTVGQVAHAQHINHQLPQSINTDGTTPDASAILDISSTDKGILIPRMTSAQRTAISGTTGLLIYDTTTDSFWYHDGSAWKEIGQGIGSGGAFEIVDGVVRSTGDHTEDFIFGRDALPENGVSIQDTFFFFNQAKGAFRGGRIVGADWSPDSLGSFSFAYGREVKATGDDGATALGRGTKATGDDGATALGSTTEATGDFGSTALGISTKATGDFGATALGYATEAIGDNGATAFGFGAKALGDFGASALGYITEATGDFGAPTMES